MLNCNIKYIVADGLDVRFYSDKRRAEQYMEPIDIKNGIYVGYDSIGRRLDISATDNACSIALAEAAPHHRDDLKKLLLSFLAATGNAVITDDHDIETLLNMCCRYLDEL